LLRWKKEKKKKKRKKRKKINNRDLTVEKADLPFKNKIGRSPNKPPVIIKNREISQ
jgi:hypothetical protein